MATPHPTPAFPGDTGPAAFAALQNLEKLNDALRQETEALPAPDDVLKAVAAADSLELERQTSVLLQRLEDYWNATSASGETRYRKFLAGMQQTLRDDLNVKIFDRDLLPEHKACLPADSSPDFQTSILTESFSLHVRLQEKEQVEVAGALVMRHEQGHTLLVLPGVGATGFRDLEEMRVTVVKWLNDPLLKDALLHCFHQSWQDVLAEVGSDPDAHLEPFTAADVVLTPLYAPLYAHAIDRLLVKQRADVRHICASALSSGGKHLQSRLGDIIRLRGLLGPGAILARRQLVELEKQYRRKLPEWFRFASEDDQAAYAERMQRYDETRMDTVSALNAAASAEQFARTQLSTRLANDLGYDLDPDTVAVSTHRTLPVTGEPYTLKRSLTELALYGLQPGDRLSGSEFLTGTTFTRAEAPLEASYSSLTPAYVAQVVEELDLRVNFETFQQGEYCKGHHQQLMRALFRDQINAQAYAAKLQGRLSADDFLIVEATMAHKDAPAPQVRVQQIRLHHQPMSKLLVLHREAPTGQPGRLIMIALDTPSSRCFWAFAHEAQLRSELVSWTASQALRDYLLNQVEVEARTSLASRLEALARIPDAAEDFLELVDLSSLEDGLQVFVEQHARVAKSEQQRHTPQWYKAASLAQRQELQALEDAASAAVRNYDAKPHTHIQPFKDYVHDQASIQISRLLNVPVGSVDPDHIVITSERETVTYTSLLLDGYDDTFGLIKSTADTHATFSGPEGVDLQALSPQKVAASVRGKWLGDDYIALISSSLLDASSAGYQYRRKTSLSITQLQMRAAALRSLLKGDIDTVQYQWLRDSINHAHLNDAATRERYPLYPLQIHIDKPLIASRLSGIDQLVVPALTEVETVQGCFAVRPTSVRLAALLYTPQAPDGVEFRPFGSFVESLHAPGMIDYYKDRCRFAARKALSFYLRDMRDGHPENAPFLPRESIADFAETCFNRPVLRKIRDVQDSTRGRSEMLAGLIWTSAEIIATVVTLPFPLASFAVGAMLATVDSVRALRALRDGDTETACAYIVSAMINSYGARGDLKYGLKGFGKVIRQLALPPDPVSVPGTTSVRSLPRYEDLFPAGWYEKSRALPHYEDLDPARSHHEQMSLRAKREAALPKQPSTSTTGRDIDPALATRDTFEVDISLHALPRLTEGHAKGVCPVKGKYYIDLSGKTFEVQYDAQMRLWQIIDPENPFAFFGKRPVRLDEHGKWQLADRLRLEGGGLDSPASYRPLTEEGAVSASNTPSDYELPEPLRQHMHTLITGESFNPVNLAPEYFESVFLQVRHKFARLRENLYQDANKFFDAPVLPPRPSLPTVTPDTPLDTFLERLFEHSNGVVLSETAKSVASKRMLIQNMPSLVKERVEILYLEHVFTDKHASKLAKYRKLGKKTRSGSRELKHHLEHVNEKALDNGTTEYDYYHLIKAAHQHGIEVRPFSSSISYPHRLHPVIRAADDTAASRKMSTFFGHKIISADVAADPTRRWVALLDEDLATTRHRLPGIAELEGVPSVHIRDVSSERPTRIITNARSATATSAKTGPDFTLEFVNPLVLSPAPVLPKSTTVDAVLFREVGSPLAKEAGERWAGAYGFRWHGVDGWVRVEPEHWAPNSPLTPIQQSLADGQYEIPLEHRDRLHRLAQLERKGLDQNYSVPDTEQAGVRDLFFAVREKLQQDARSVVSAELPPRPIMPVIEPQTPLPEFLAKLYEHTDGVVIGEEHASIASKQLIIDNLPTLSKQKVKTLYLEHLMTDLHQADLDRFFETGQMSKTLLHDLKIMDRGHRTDPTGIYTFEQLVVKAQQNGIEIRAIDCAASYHLKGIPNEAPTTREQMMNYFASRTIRKHQEVMGPHKWIALVGNSHSNTFQKLIPGLAELEGGIGVRVRDVSIGQSRGISHDPGERFRIGLSTETAQVKGDYLVEIEALAAPRRSVLLSPAQQLHRPGMFMVEETESGLYVIIHRSRDTTIHHTPVMTNADGKLYVDRPSWTAVHFQPYDDIEALIKALEDSDLRLMSMRHRLGSV